MPISKIAKLNRQSQNSFFAALILISAIAMYKWMLSPHLSLLYAAQQHNSVVSQAVEKNEAVAREINVKTKKLNKLQEQFTLSLDKLFTPEQAKDFFGGLHAIFEETDCTVHSINLVVDKSLSKKKQPKDTSDVVANSAILSVSGGYNSIVGLVERLQNHTPTVWIDTFNMDVIDFSTGRLKCDMAITIYTIKDMEGIS